MQGHKKSEYPLLAPVVKWVGGKRQLLDEIVTRFPPKFGTYYEPFFGGGAVLFSKQPSKAVINDLNSDLIKVYRLIKTDPDSLIEELKLFRNDKDFFYKVRELDRNKLLFDKMPDVKRAARLIFLNKTCYNGLYRVNSAGEFNTPFGGYKNPNIVNEAGIHAAHAYFSDIDITILNGDYAKAVETAKSKDFVYFDPPYDPISNSSAFTGYNEGGFDKSEQERLHGVCLELTKRGVYVLISNSSTPFIHDLYRDPEFHIDIVKAKRCVNSIGDRRGDVDEVLINNYAYVKKERQK